MEGQIALDMIVAFAITGAFVTMLILVSYAAGGAAHAKLSGLSNEMTRASLALNYSINPAQAFKIYGS